MNNPGETQKNMGKRGESGGNIEKHGKHGEAGENIDKHKKTRDNVGKTGEFMGTRGNFYIY